LFSFLKIIAPADFSTGMFLRYRSVKFKIQISKIKMTERIKLFDYYKTLKPKTKAAFARVLKFLINFISKT
jgi:hypothetical protein